MKTVTIDGVTLTAEQVENAYKEIHAEPKPWPQVKDSYWTVDCFYGTPWRKLWANDTFDRFNQSLGLVFRTEKEAYECLRTGWIAKRQAEVRIENYIKAKGYEFTPDYNDPRQIRYTIDGYNHQINSWMKGWSWGHNHFAPSFVFSCREHRDGVITNCDADLRIFFGIPAKDQVCKTANR